MNQISSKDHPVILIDGDPIVYIFSYRYKNKEVSEKNLDRLESNIKHYIEAIKNKCLSSICIGFIKNSISGNYRKDFCTEFTYKIGRKKKNYVSYWKEYIYFILKKINFYEVPKTIEVDDILNILNKKITNNIIVSPDKDLLQIPTIHYNPNTKQFVDSTISEIKLEKNKLTGTGWKFFLCQMITGDSTDSIPGIYKKGPKYAYNLLKEESSYINGFRKVINCYKENHTDKYLKDNYVCLKLLNNINVRYIAKKVKDSIIEFEENILQKVLDEKRSFD